jgi:type III restriction enzyme
MNWRPIGLVPGAGGKAHAAMHKMLDDFIAERTLRRLPKNARSVMTVEGRTIIADLKTGETTRPVSSKPTRMTSVV